MTVNNLAKFPISKRRLELLHYPLDVSDTEWVDNEPTMLTLHVLETVRGRSAAYFMWVDSVGRNWPMFLTDLADVLRHCEIRGGKVSAMWKVRKRGQNYGIALAEVPE